MHAGRFGFGVLMALLGGLGGVRGEGLVVSEIFYHPASTNVLEEFVELHNTGSSPLVLAGARFESGIHFTFPPSATIPSGGYLVVAADEATFAARHPTVTNRVAGWVGTLSDDGERLALVDAAGLPLAEVEYAPDGDWAVRRMGAPDAYGKSGWEWWAPHDGQGASLELIQPGMPMASPLNWGASTVLGGTPGAPNSVARDNVAPLISHVLHWPAIPQPNDSVVLTARVRDEQSTGLEVRLWFREDGPTPFQELPMWDDGAHGDGLPQDGLFGVVLSPRVAGTLVEYYVTAADAEGQVRTYPATLPSGTARTANLLYQVDEEPFVGHQPLYRILLTQAEYDYLKDVWRTEPESDAEVNGAWITLDESHSGGNGTQVHQLASFRNRGHGTRTSVPHNIHVSIPRDRLWQGRRGINLNTQYTQSQVLGSALMRQAGVPMAEARAARVRINGRDLAGAGSPQFEVYAATELVDGDLIDRQFPEDAGGNFYRGTRDVYPGNPKADLSWKGASFTGYTNAYFKQNHLERNDWSDLIGLLDVLNNTPDAGYAAAVRSVVEVEEWMRYFAMNTLLGNQETALGTGYGDDFALYAGLRDRRFRLMAYDLDSVLGKGTRDTTYADGLFRMFGSGSHSLPVVQRFVQHPEFVPEYYRQLSELADRFFEPSRMNPILDQLAQMFPASPELTTALERMKAFNASHVAYVRSLIPRKLTVVSGLPVLNGYASSTSAQVELSGRAPAVATRRVEVNGVPATWSAWEATWSLPSLSVSPGLNRLEIRALDGLDQVVDRLLWDVWYDDGSVATVGGTVTQNTLWTAAGGPYQLTSDLTIPSGVTLTVEPGTTLYLESGVDIRVANGGRLLLEGTQRLPIRLTRSPGATTRWGGIVVEGAVGSPETRLQHVLIEFNGTTAIEVAAGTVWLENVVFGSPDQQYASLDGASFVLSRCHFPTATDTFELVHGTQGIKAGGHGLIRECFFGGTIGYNDVVDFTGGNRPGPILQIQGNVFASGSDDALDLDGTDAWVEGNIFLHIHKNGAPDSSSAVSGGNSGGQTSEITVLGNLIFDCDQAATAKQGNFFTLFHNTIVRMTKEGGRDTESGVVNPQDRDPSPTTYGRGFYLEGNIVLEAEQLVRNHDPAQAPVTWVRNLLSIPWEGAGSGNEVGDPLFVHVPTLAESQFETWEEAQVLWRWFSLREGSPARGMGPLGRDQGAVVPTGIAVFGVPTSPTPERSVQLQVGLNRQGQGIPVSGWPEGSGYTHYRWRLDGSPWSDLVPVAQALVLTDLADGPHQVEVVGRRDSGMEQDDPLLGTYGIVTRSPVWVVDPNAMVPRRPALQLSEVLAKNLTYPAGSGLLPDLVELVNQGTQEFDLAGLGLTDDPAVPFKYVVPAGTRLSPGAFLVLAGDDATAEPGLHLGFALKQEGDGLYLFDRADRGGQLLDSVVFGPQLADYSIGRRADGSWGLCRPTFGTANRVQPTGNTGHLVINEWLANAQFVAADDFVELYNPEDRPVALAGLHLSDAPGQADRQTLPALSYLGPKACLALWADGDHQGRAQHLNFRLAAEGGTLHLSQADLTPIDSICYGPQRSDVSQGRTPSGAAVWTYFPTPTPGGLNPGDPSGTNQVTVTVTPLIAYSHFWKYHAAGAEPGPAWTTPTFDDSSWAAGAGLLGVETSTPYPYPVPIQTPLPLQVGGSRIKTYYFRTHFEVGTNLAGLSLQTTNLLDDGAVFHLNGQRVAALRVSADPAQYSSDASSQPDEGQAEVVTLPTAQLVPGDNVLAVEVHQSGSSSSDVVFGLALSAIQTVTNDFPVTGVPVVLNEIFTRNVSRPTLAGQLCGWVELWNPSAEAVDLTDFSLSDRADVPRRWVFPPGSTISARSFQRVCFDPAQPDSATNASFKLPVQGGSVFLFDRPSRGGVEVDAVTFGLSAADFSVGRVPDGGNGWRLTQPTELSANVAAGLGSPLALRINEWMADPSSGADWFEVYNSDSAPVALGGLYLTDDLSNRTKSPIPPLSFIGTGRSGFVQFLADKGVGANHVGFRLARAGSTLGLFAGSGLQIDALSFGSQATGVSQGRIPDGSSTWSRFPGTPTPGAANTSVVREPDVDEDGLPDAWEQLHGLTVGINDAAGDLDGDGWTNREEFQAGTDPQNAASSLRLVVWSESETSTSLTFAGVQGRSYTVQVSSSLESSQWDRWLDVPARAADGPVTVLDSAPTQGTRFYRVITPALP